ncbi:cytochrome c oxidase accessory protein CcoG, partial [Oleiphilus sp. HI0078]
MDIENKIAHRFKSSDSNLYASHEKVHTREVKGVFQSLRKAMMFTLLGLYYFAAWFTWDGHQAILFDLPERQFHIFWLTFWPQDFFFLAWLLIMAALSLFFFTALAGRLWCGYACPQTVWTEAFVWMERIIEGDRGAQLKLEKMPWNAEKIRKRGTKQLVWLLFSLWTGFTLVGYFTPIRELSASLWTTLSGTYTLGPWETFWILFYGFATYGNSGYLREQVCLYMCPYARFQSAMFDKDTLIVSYDDDRGEPRVKGKKRKEMADQAGDCVDCSLCVQVCPTGIDIREGLQYECIGCAACVDVCDQVMEKVSKPQGLIRYTTEHSLHHEKTKILRPRIVAYAILLVALFVAFVIAIAMRSPLAVDVLRDRGALYRVIDASNIENVYNFKVMNKSKNAQTYQIDVSGIDGAKVSYNEVQKIAPGEVGNVTVTVASPVASLDKPIETLEFTISTKIEDDIYKVQESS